MIGLGYIEFLIGVFIGIVWYFAARICVKLDDTYTRLGAVIDRIDSLASRVGAVPTSTQDKAQ